MMRFFLFFLVSFTLLISTVPCHSGTGPTVSEPAMSDSIDPVTHAPLTSSTLFRPETGTLYATVKLSDAPRKTEVKALFFLVGESEQQIAEDAMVTNGTGYVSFELNPPASGWPLRQARSKVEIHPIKHSVIVSSGFLSSCRKTGSSM